MAEESTTPDLVELLRQGLEPLNRGDLDALMELYAPEAVLDTTRTVGVAFHGRAAIRGLYEDWMGAYEELEWMVDEPLDAGGGVVFAVARQKARPVGTIGYVQQREGIFWVYVDGLCVSQTVYPEADIDEARAAAERLAQERVDG
jgi:ketosteroid isomerase-like protein